MKNQNKICANCGKPKDKFHSKKNLFCKDIDAKPLQRFVQKKEVLNGK